MNREILFRGKCIEDNCDERGKWVYGYLVHGTYFDDSEMTIIVEPDVTFYPGCEMSGFEIVDRETVGQYTGLKDKNGNKIFEGDVLDDEPYGIAVIGYSKSSFNYRYVDDLPTQTHSIDCYEFGTCVDMCEIIGNVHDNPELLVEGEK